MEVGGLHISAALPSALPERLITFPLRLRHHLFSSPSHGAAASFQRFCALATSISSVRAGHRAAPPESSRQRVRVVYSGGDGEDTGLGIGEEAAASTSSPLSSSPYAVATAALLSLSEKPDRSVALLDEYEMEELEPPDPNHRSGTDNRAARAAFLYHDIIVAQSFILIGCPLFTLMVKVRDFEQFNPVDSSRPRGVTNTGSLRPKKGFTWEAAP